AFPTDGTHTVTASYGGDGCFTASGSGTVTEAVSPMTAANLQAALPAAGGTVTVAADNQDAVNTVITAGHGLAAPAQPATVVVDLGANNFTDLNPQPPAGVTLVINGDGTTTTFVGQSPALTVTSGAVVVTGVRFVTATNSPTILVTGGSLTL